MSNFIIIKSDKEKECIDLDEVCAIRNEGAQTRCDDPMLIKNKQYVVYVLRILFKNGQYSSIDFMAKDTADRVFNGVSRELMK
jgi:hypothetical protein